ncbi:MAG: ABC transporter permease [Gemmatimonadetes bacterium]|nr:ABC transporter permease [Gemmatimonadota bacterium]
MRRVFEDARIATRALVRRPGFALTALLTIAIAVASNTAIFSVVRAVLLAPLPFREPAELVTLDVRSYAGHEISASVPNYRDWSEHSRSFRSTAGSAPWGMSATGNGPATVIAVRVVLGNFFGTLGLEPGIGRTIASGETEPGSEAVAVLGFGYWQSAYGGDPGIIGRAITLDGRPYPVVGVLADGQGFPAPSVDAYVPMGTLPGLPWSDRRSSFGMRIVARLVPGVTLPEARSDLERVGRQVRESAGPDTALPEVRALDEFFTGKVRLRAEPGVRSAAAALLLPLSERSWERGIWPEGVPPIPGTGQSVLYSIVSPEYFQTLGVSIVQGRAFDETDRPGAPAVAIIDETMAARFWPGENAVGKRVTFEMTAGTHEGDPIYRTVIGVAKNVRHYELASPSRIQVYVPWTQILAGGRPELALTAKTTARPAALIPTMRRVVAELDRDVPVSDVQTIQDYVESGLSGSRALGDLLSVFGAMALLLASVGIFGVMSYTVAQRTREIGVRMAIGATRAEVLRWVTSRALVLSATGAALGIGAAAALSRLLSRMLFQVSPLDPLTFAGVVVLLLGAALLAALLPARRATSVNPVEALRQE